MYKKVHGYLVGKVHKLTHLSSQSTLLSKLLIDYYYYSYYSSRTIVCFTLRDLVTLTFFFLRPRMSRSLPVPLRVDCLSVPKK